MGHNSFGINDYENKIQHMQSIQSSHQDEEGDALAMCIQKTGQNFFPDFVSNMRKLKH